MSEPENIPPKSEATTAVILPQRGIHARKLIGGLLYQGLSNFSGVLTSLVLMPVVIKSSGSATFGAFVVLNTLLTLTAQAFSLGAGYKCRRQLPSAEDAGARSALFLPNASIQLITYTAAALAIISALDIIQRTLLVGLPRLQWWIVPVALAATYLNILSDDYFRYTHRLKFIGLAAAARAICYTALVVLLATGLQPLTAGQLLLAQSVATILPALCLWLFIAREIPLRFRLDAWTQHRWDIRFGLPLLTAVLVENFLATSDRYILAGLLTPAHVGAYAAAFAVGSLILLVPKVVSSVLPAALSQAVDQGRRTEATALFNHILQFYFLLAMPFVAGCALLARPVLALLGNAEVTALGAHAVPIIAIASALYGYTWMIFSSLFVEMDTRLWFRANVAAAITAVTLNLILVSIFRRIEAAAMAMLVSYAVSAAIIERQRSRAWPIRMDLPMLGKMLLGTAVMSLCVMGITRWPLLHTSMMLTAIVPAVAGALIYGLILWRLGALPLSDLYRLFRRPVALV